MQNEWSYIRDSIDFINKINILEYKLSNSMLVRAGVIGLYPSIFFESGLSANKEALENTAMKSFPTRDILKML